MLANTSQGTLSTLDDNYNMDDLENSDFVGLTPADDIAQDPAGSDYAESAQDARGGDDDDYEEDGDDNERDDEEMSYEANVSGRTSPHAESSTSDQAASPSPPRRPSSKKSKSDSTFNELDPDLYLLRRSGRARHQPSRFEEAFHPSESPSDSENMDSDEDGDEYGSGRSSKRKRGKSSRKAKQSKARQNRIIREDTVEESEESAHYTSEESEDEVDWGERPRKRHASSRRKGKSKKARKSNHPDPIDTPSYAEQRFSSRARSTKNYDESANSIDYGLSDEDEELEREKNKKRKVNYQEVEEDQGIDQVLDYRIVPMTNEENEEEEEDVYEFLVKWKGKSHRHNTWHSADELKGEKSYRKVENFYKNKVEDDRRFMSDPYTTPEEKEQREVQNEMNRNALRDYQQVERVVASRETQYGTEYYIKWKQLPYNECTWELASDISGEYQAEIDSFLGRQESITLPYRSAVKGTQRPRYEKFDIQPAYMAGGKLRDYQLLGVNWMAWLWHRNDNGILADEMGLGKTVQSISFLNYLFNHVQLYGPFLVVVPLSTIGSWQREFARWAPDINVVLYTGSSAARQIIRDTEFYTHVTGARGGNYGKKVKFNALLTTYDFILRDKVELGQIKWAYLAVDEAHRLKNADSQLHEALNDFHTGNRLLITGTPLQNSIRELLALTRFIMPDRFHEFENFEIDMNAGGSEAEQERKILELQDALKPYMLRRLKRDVEKSLPTKTERILRIDLSPMQLMYYKAIYTKNFSSLASSQTSRNAQGGASLMNVAMELKKASNHPYLFEGAEDVSVINKQEQLRGIIANSGKMVLLDKLLARLKEGGHRVLVFSQMVRLLDILSDYMRLRGYQYQRLDGTVPSEQRKRAMEHFNAEGSNDFVFLLSTKAGGLGLNLETADTVVIFDSDWNPQNDLQAMARAHRIGQKKTVNVYRFVAKDTIEEEIIERAKRKMVLEYAIIKQMDTSGRGLLQKGTDTSSTNQMSREELQTILKFGAKNLFKAHDSATINGHDTTTNGQPPEEAIITAESAAAKRLEELNLDDVLARAEESETTADGGGATDGGAEFLEQWRIADVGINELSWDAIIPEGERKKAQDEERRKEEEEMASRARRAAAHTASYNEGGHDHEETRKKRGRKSGGGGGATRKKESAATDKLDEKDIRALYRAMLKWGHPEDRYEEVVRDAELEDKDYDAVVDIAHRLHEACKEAVVEHEKAVADISDRREKRKEKAVNIVFEGAAGVNAKQLCSRLHDMTLAMPRLKQAANKPSTFRLSNQMKSVNWTQPWTHKEDAMLVAGLALHGFGSWPEIQNDPQLGLQGRFFLGSEGKSSKDGEDGGNDEKDDHKEKGDKPKSLPKAVHLVRRGEYLLKTLAQEEEERNRRSRASAARPSSRAVNGTAARKSGGDTSARPKMKSSRAPVFSKAVKKTNNHTSGGERRSKAADSSSDKKLSKSRRSKFRPSGSNLFGNDTSDLSSLDEESSSAESESITAEERERYKVLLKPLKHEIKAIERINGNSKYTKDQQAAVVRDTLFKVGSFVKTEVHKFESEADRLRLESRLWQYISQYMWVAEVEWIKLKGAFDKEDQRRKDEKVGGNSSSNKYLSNNATNTSLSHHVL
ncbi:hypothetical protein SeMB42_g05049 [Synchytrium endobioticum]|uniref:DNA helicase n=1 Tax=Synchytrium endobioticum TaxID=286115 RepID=A0A507CTY6_9FUNG|nr:hypothetical protein SeLEV6574_g06118 [Synchytrium endobioticum]TPX42617.1 hypothetical protein SeMB42_g05049 [Synchytrium endobioticum]